MQSQMDAKLATLGIKTPSIGSFPSPASPSARNFGRQSLAAESPVIYTPDSTGGNTEAAATLAQQRAKLQSKTNAAHRISAPSLANSVWSPSAGNQLGQVAEQEQQTSSNTLAPPPSAGGPRPKSMDLSSLSNLRSPRTSTNPTVTSDADGNDVTISPIVGGNWASMVNTPAAPMFEQDSTRAQQNLDAATMKLYNSTGANSGSSNRFVLDDPKAFRRSTKSTMSTRSTSGDSKNAGMYDNDGNPIQSNQTQPGLPRGNNRNNNNQGGGFGWNGGRSPALSGRFSENNMADAGMLNGLGGFGLGNPNLMGMNMNMMGMPGFNMGMLANLNALAAGMSSPDAQAAAQAQLFAAQMAALSGQPGMMNGLGFGGMGGAGGGFRSPVSARHGGSVRSPTERRSTRGGGGDKPDEEVDPQLLEDVSAWLRSLRLHKYTPNFENMNWRQMVAMNEQQLEDKGVAALGARRKMLKTFEHVRNKMGIPHPEGSTTGSGAGSASATSASAA